MYTMALLVLISKMACFDHVAAYWRMRLQEKNKFNGWDDL